MSMPQFSQNNFCIAWPSHTSHCLRCHFLSIDRLQRHRHRSVCSITSFNFKMINKSATSASANLDDIEVPHMLGEDHREAKITTPTDDRRQEDSDDSSDIDGENGEGRPTSTNMTNSSSSCRVLLGVGILLLVSGTATIVTLTSGGASSSIGAFNNAAVAFVEKMAKATKAPKANGQKFEYDDCPAGSDQTKGRLPNSVCDDQNTFGDCQNCCEKKCKVHFCTGGVCCGDFATQCVANGQTCYMGQYNPASPELCSCCCSGKYDNCGPYLGSGPPGGQQCQCLA